MKSKLFLGIVAGLSLFASIARSDTFYVANSGINSITKYDSNGIELPFAGGAIIGGPIGLALDAAGNLYASTGANTIRKFTPAGLDLGVFASTGLNFPMALAFDSSGNLYAANFSGTTIEKFGPNGADLGVFAVVTGPTGLAFDAVGNLYVSNVGNTILRFSPNGVPLGTFANTGLNRPQAIAFDSSGFLYAANNGSNTIEVFSSGGIDLGTLPTTGLSGPVGLAFGSDENLYVVNALSATVRKILPSGVGFDFATTGFSPAFIAVQKSTVTASTPTLVNISTRLNVLTDENVLDGGFIIVGSGAKTVLIRGLGPSLAGAGIQGALADPIIELHNGTTNAIITSNDNWKNNQQSQIEATGIPPTNDAESALIATLTEGAYTVIERGKLDTTGIGLLEIYDLNAGVGPELANISTRGFVDSGSNVMIAGVIVGSIPGGSSEVIVRALGPSLSDFGVANPLADPTLELHDSNGTLTAANDNWKTDQQSLIILTGVPPTNDAEAAIVATLLPGAYTAVASGKDGAAGVGLVEVFNLH